MQNYVNQLLTDMAAAEKNLPPEVDYALLYPDHPAVAYGLNYIAEYEMSPRHSFDDLLGIKAEQLPPDDKLSDEQVAQLNHGIVALWKAFNISPDLLDGVPSRLVYKALKNYWATETVQYVSEGRIHIEFCDYNPDECPWGSDYCSCKEFADEPVREFTPEETAKWEKGVVHHPNGGISWVNPDFLDKNGNLDPTKFPF